MTRRRVLVLLVLGWLLVSWALALFSAEDAYVVARYAHQLVTHGELVYNLGERVNALTSPIHVFVYAALEAAGWNSVIAGKAVAVAITLAALVAVARRYHDPAPLAIFAVLAVSPFAALWTVGGLETPYLYAANAVAAILALRPGRGYALVVAVCAAILFRPDSAVFWGPAWAVLAMRRPLAGPTLLGVMIGGTWLVTTTAYYGTPLPTSFYIKTPGLARWAQNLIYIAQFVVLSGVAYFAISLRPDRNHLTRFAWAYAGLASFCLYAVTAATTHMMFGYRLFVPMLPMLAILGAEAARSRSVAVWPLALTAAQSLCLIPALLWIGLNPSLVGEYRWKNATENATLLRALEDAALDVRDHWEQRQTSRPARVQSNLEGAFPYHFPDSYIFGHLVSYRHQCQVDVEAASDYWLRMISPDRLEELRINGEIEIVAERHAVYERREFVVVVLLNPEKPRPNRLPNIVGAPCDS